MPAIQRINATNILSFGSDGVDIKLKNLNVLIGANGSGKSNFLDLFALLKGTTSDVQALIRGGGGVLDWLWKGGSIHSVASLDVFIPHPNSEKNRIKHLIAFTAENATFSLFDEKIENELPLNGYQDVRFFLSVANSLLVRPFGLN